jgi:hypothetical protein
MALSELAALEAAYQVLQPLDAAGRRRALQWLSDALAAGTPLTVDAAAPSSAEPAAADTAPATGRQARRRTATPPTRAKRSRGGRTEAAEDGDIPERTSRTSRTERAGRPEAAERTERAGRSRRSGRRAAEPGPADQPGDAGRAYRRMPPADEVIDIYQHTGTIIGVAAHYGVPRHTAQGWARQLRRHGYAIGRAQ